MLYKSKLLAGKSATYWMIEALNGEQGRSSCFVIFYPFEKKCCISLRSKLKTTAKVAFFKYSDK